jgi:phosphate transport system substrate-binding protein
VKFGIEGDQTKSRARSKRSLVVAAFAAVLLLVAAVGCAETDDDSGGAGDGLSGRIQVDGSATLEPFTTLAAERFQEEHPQVGVIVGITPARTGGGFERFCAGETDLSNASRPIEPDERETCRERGIEYVTFQVANDALTVVVNPANHWADCLTIRELRRIWAPGSGVGSWRDVRAGFPTVDLELYGPSTDSGTFEYFTDAILGEQGAKRTDYRASQDDNATVEGVARSRGGLGYFGLSFFDENEDRLKALQIDSGSGCVAPSVETAQSGQYTPLSRPLFVYAQTEAFREPHVRAFVEYALDNAVSLAQDTHLVPVTEEQLEREQEKFEEAVREVSD